MQFSRFFSGAHPPCLHIWFGLAPSQVEAFYWLAPGDARKVSTVDNLSFEHEIVIRGYFRSFGMYAGSFQGPLIVQSNSSNAISWASGVVIGP